MTNATLEATEVVTKTEVVTTQETDESILKNNDVQFRIQTDGKRWKVLDNKGFGGSWEDDIWGGYFPSYEKAAERVEDRKKFWVGLLRDRETAKNFTDARKP